MRSSLAIIVVPFAGKGYLTRCLRAVERQEGVTGLEVIVPCDRNLGDVAALEKAHPEVQFMRLEGYHTAAELRASGIRQAAGSIVAITEDHCEPDPDWCSQILHAHEDAHAAVGGVVEKQDPDTILNWAVYFADYLRYMNPVSEGPTRSLTDLNASYKRAALASIDHVWLHEFHEPVINGALLQKGESLWLSPRIVVNQQRSLGLREALWDRYAFGRLFASTRISGLSGAGRWRYIAASPLVPVLLLARILVQICQKRRRLAQAVRALPALVVLSMVWSYGEFVGSVTGRPHPSLSPSRQLSPAHVRNSPNLL